MAVRRWVGLNGGPTFRPPYRSSREILFVCTRHIAICNAVYRLTMFCCVPEIFAIKSGSCLKSRQKFIALGNEANFINSGHQLTIELVAKSGVDRLNDLRLGD